MQHQRLVRVVCGVALTLATAASAQPAPFATAAEAKAMLDRVVAAVKADKVKALEMFNKGEDGFRYRDLQPFCFNMSDGITTAATVPQLLGTDVRALKDEHGKAVGQAIYQAAREGEIREVSYVFPRPGTDAPLFHKVSLITRVGDQGCGVGYFE